MCSHAFLSVGFEIQLKKSQVGFESFLDVTSTIIDTTVNFEILWDKLRTKCQVSYNFGILVSFGACKTNGIGTSRS